jgi:protein ImuA
MPVDLPERSSSPVLSSRQHMIEDLRTHIRRIEGRAGFVAPAVPATPMPGAWTLGVAAIDTLLGPAGLDIGGLHEIRSETVADGTGAAAATAARRAFALLLGVRRGLSLPRAGPLLWCLPLGLAHETGAPYSRGLAALGLDPDQIVIVTPRRAQDVPWVLEEALKAACLSLVLGEVAAVGVSAARRLSLAAAESHTPCLLVSCAGRTPAIATATRWRVAPRPGAADAFDALAPGARGFRVALERCRARPLVSDASDFAVEWCDDARCFRMAAAVPDRASAPGAHPRPRPDAAAIASLPVRRRA